MEFQKTAEVFTVADVPKNQGLNLTRYMYRMTFSKKGRAKFISHLDLMRAMQRTFKRAGLPIWYTQGFNPHPYIMFPLALSLGVESEIEPMDVALLEKLENEEIKSRLNMVMPEGIRIETVGEPVCDHLDIYRSDYEIIIKTDRPPEETLKFFSEFVSADEIIIKKRLKPKKNRRETHREIDVREYVKLLGIEASNEGVKINIRLATSAGNDFNLNYTPLLDAFSEKYNIDINYISAKRTKILCRNGENFI